MPMLSKACHHLLLSVGLAAASASGAVHAEKAASAEEAANVTDATVNAASGNAVSGNVVSDPHAWLEDVEGERQLAWVKQRNASTEAELAATPEFKRLEAEILAILDSDAKIPAVEKIGEHY